MNVKLRKIGNSYGVILPAEVVTALNVREGGHLSLLPDENGTGYRLTADDAEFERQMAVARDLMKRYHATLRELAK